MNKKSYENYLYLYLKELINNVDNQRRIKELEKENKEIIKELISLQEELIKYQKDLDFLESEYYCD